MDLALSDYDPQKINGHRIPHAVLRSICLRLQSLPLEERRKIPGLERGREDLIGAGAAVILSLLEVFELSGLEVIDSGLLEGILLEGMDRMRNAQFGMRNGK
jgi:exopolyphosphatase/guanosine-5'-triphosphate,3'-diphosphate pyrophosphatase